MTTNEVQKSRFDTGDGSDFLLRFFLPFFELIEVDGIALVKAERLADLCFLDGTTPIEMAEAEGWLCVGGLRRQDKKKDG